MRPSTSESCAVGVSVVIPAYNYAHYLPCAIESVLAQTHSELECIVVDDGSTDSTKDVVTSIADPRLRYLSKENGGLSSARNAGMRAAKYSLVAFLDADDRWLPNFLEQTVATLTNLPPRFGAVASASHRMNERAERVEGVHFTFGASGELTFRDFCLRNRPLSSSVLVRKDTIDACGEFDPKLRSSEDRDYWLRMTAKGWGFYFLNEPLAEIRRHSHNMSKAASRMQVNTREVLARARQAGAIHRLSPFWLKVTSLRLFQSARAFHGEGSTLAALLLWARSCLLWPVFGSPATISERPFFRARFFVRLLLDSCRGHAK